MKTFQNKLRQADNKLAYVYFGVLLVITALFLLCLEYMGLKMPVLRWLPVPVYLFIAWALLRGEYFSRPLYLVGFVFLFWYLLSRFLLGDSSLRLSSGTLVEMCTVYGFAFLFARMSGDKNRRFLNALLTGLTLIFAVYAAVSIIAGVTMTSITLPGGVNATYVYIDSRVYIMGLNPNFCAPFLVFGMLFTVYLLLEYNIPWLWIPGAFLEIIFFWSLALTNSLGARYGLVLAVAPVSALLFSRFVKVRKNWILVPVMILGMLLTWYSFNLTGLMLNGLMREFSGNTDEEQTETVSEEEPEIELVYERQSIVENPSISGRSWVYETVWEWLEAHPKNLWLGNFESRIFMILGNAEQNILYYGYLHSSLIQTLCVVGIPGLLIILILCVILFVLSLRVLFNKKLSVSDKMLPVLILPVAVQGLIESFLFVTSASLIFSSVDNLLFFLLAGYIVELKKEP